MTAPSPRRPPARWRRYLVIAPVLFGGGLVVGCASAPKVVPPPPISIEQKMGWMLRLEDRRVLRDPPPPPVPILPQAKGKPRLPAVAPPPAPDLVKLLADPEARVRRRAALAIGRVGLAEGVPPLAQLLADPEPEVRQMSAFALGLIGDRSAADALRAALKDPSPLVQGRAAEALGLIGDTGAAPAIGELIRTAVQAGTLAAIPADETAPEDPAADACRLAVFALARLKAYEPLAAAVLDGAGQPVVRWWPIAYALARIEDTRAAPALLTLLKSDGRLTRAFAARGVGAFKERAAVDLLLPMAEAWARDPQTGVAAIRALGQIGDQRAVPLLLKLVQARDMDAGLRVEVVTALGSLHAPAALDLLLDLLSHPSPAVRAAAFRAVRELDPQSFLVVLSGLDPDPQWSVRAAIGTILGTMDPEVALPRLTAMSKDSDLRVIPSVLGALVRLRAAGVGAMLLDRLKADDFVVRMAAAAGIGELKPPGGDAALAAAYALGERDATYVARAAALAALARYGAGAAMPTLKRAMADKDWAVRIRAAQLVKELDPKADPARDIRPAPTDRAPAGYEVPSLVAPTVSPHAYVDTAKGTIEIELAVLDAPLTVENFTALARKGFFNGLEIHRVVPTFVVQDGDPRGDGEGGPGYTIRDEINERPYLRGTVGMALDWADTGGSQFFITHSPQPHLDARYTVFGQVVTGIEVVDRLQQGDTIKQVRVWDGTTQ